MRRYKGRPDTFRTDLVQQWASNNTDVLKCVNDKSLDNDFKLHKDYITWTLGIYWKTKEDSFVYFIKNPDTNKIITKIVILSEISKLFDPLGILGPIILFAKLIMQKPSRICK